jgi:hypothetical protein
MVNMYHHVTKAQCFILRVNIPGWLAIVNIVNNSPVNMA